MLLGEEGGDREKERPRGEHEGRGERMDRSRGESTDVDWKG
jgi:hypothetical protein